ncbi:MAG: glycosyltransferase family 2 protein [Opitutales bacterium]
MSDLSVIIPTYNRPDNLRGCLRALRESDAGARAEVIVSDDGGSADLEPLCREFGARLVRGPNQGPATARNRGAAVASGYVFVFLDDDCQVELECLSQLQEAVAGEEQGVIGGHCVNGLPRNPFSEVSQRITNGLIAVTSGTDQPFLPSCLLALRRSCFEAIGGFDPSFPLAAGEDRAFCRMAIRQARALRQNPEARATHFHHLGLTNFLRQHYRYGQGARQLEHAFGPEALLNRQQRWSFFSHCLAEPTAQRIVAICLAQVATRAGYAAAGRAREVSPPPVLGGSGTNPEIKPPDKLRECETE